MCLLLPKRSLPLIAQDDIVCYKVLIEDLSFNCDVGLLSPYRTPFMDYIIPKNALNGNETLKVWPVIRVTTPLDVVEQGFIHTYKEEADALRVCNKFSNPVADAKAFKCIIPKGTEYYEGTDRSSNAPSYAAKEIKFVQE